MFKLNIGSTKFNVYFRYRPVPDRRYDRDHDVPLRKTECYIERTNGSNSLIDITYGETVQSRQDNFCRATGRKIALARALHNLTNDRNVRKAFWYAYQCRIAMGDEKEYRAVMNSDEIVDELGMLVSA